MDSFCWRISFTVGHDKGIVVNESCSKNPSLCIAVISAVGYKRAFYREFDAL